MAGNRRIRQRPTTPNLKLAQSQQERLHTANPTSPPDTPTTSPAWSRKSSLKPRHQQPYFDEASQFLAQDASIHPFGTGHQFSYRPKAAAEQLSPRSSSSSSSDSESEASDATDESDDSLPQHQTFSHHPRQMAVVEESESGNSGDDESDESLSEAQSSDDDEDEDGDEDEEQEGDDEDDGNQENDKDDSSVGEEPEARQRFHVHSSSTTLFCNFVIEEVDPMDSDCDGLEVLLPAEIESIRSRSRSRQRGLDKSMMADLRNLNCSNEASDNDADPDETAFLERQKELRRIRRVSMSSSFGKRTHSELSDSDDDAVGGSHVDVDEVGSSARRMRKRLHRGSLLFQDPPAPRIDELDEPNSSEDEFAAVDGLAQELPYWTMEIIEIESP